MKILASILLSVSAASAAMAGNLEDQSASLRDGFAGLQLPSLAAAVEVPAAEAGDVKAPPAQNWAEAAKAAYLSELDAGGLTGFADMQELPPGARYCLEREWEILPEGPGNSAEAFKLNVKGRTAFVVQSYIYSDSMRAYIFDAAGNFVAYGEGDAWTDFAWKPRPDASSKAAGSWSESAKAAAERELNAGGFTAFADVKELPPGARYCLEREWEILPEGPGNSAEAFKLGVNGRTAFVVQSYIHSDSMRLYIFDAAGNFVAYGEGDAWTDFAWKPRPR